MKKTAMTVLAAIIVFTQSTLTASAQGFPVAKYLEDPEHKDDITGFYLNAVFTGMNLANQRAKPPLFCMNPDNIAESAYEMIDRRISRLQQEKRLNEQMTVDSIMLDILMEEYPCR